MITQFTVCIDFDTELFQARRDYVVATLAEVETILARTKAYNYTVVGHNCQQVMTVGEVFADIASERQERAKIARGAR